MIYVDNCCTVRKLLNQIFPDAFVALDEWHWMRRWDAALVDPSSEEGVTFKISVRKMLNVQLLMSTVKRSTFLKKNLVASQPTKKF